MLCWSPKGKLLNVLSERPLSGSALRSEWPKVGANQTFVKAVAAAISEAIDVTLAWSCKSLAFSSGPDLD